MLPSNQNKSKELFKILVAAAWIDGEIQNEEREYLAKIAKDHEIAADREVQELFSQTQAMSSTECYQLLENYFDGNPSSEDYHNLLTSISALLYSDGNIDTEEAKLLTQLQEFDPANSTSNSKFDKVLSKIQKLYRQSLASL